MSDETPYVPSWEKESSKYVPSWEDEGKKKASDDSPRSFTQSMSARAGEAMDEKPSGFASLIRSKVLGFDPLTPISKAFGVASSPLGAAGETLERKAGQAVGADPKKLEKAARDTGDVTENLLQILPGGKVAKGAEVVGKVATPLAETVTHPIFHPIDTAGKVVDTAMKVGGEVLKPVVKPAVRGVLESDNNIIGGGLKTALQSKEAQETQELGKRMGVNFSAGEMTGNPMARNIEDALANSARWSSKFTEANTQKTDAIVKNFQKTLDSIYSQKTSEAGVGNRLTSAYKGTLDSLRSTRSAQADADFKLAREATGDAPIYEPKNAIAVFKKYIQEGASPTANKEQQATARTATKALEKLTEKAQKPSTILDASGKPIERPSVPKYKKISASDFQNALKGYGDAGKSPGTFSGNIKTASDLRFDKEAYHAYQDDLNAAADSGVGEGANALKTARDHFRMNSEKIADIEKTTLGKIVGNAKRNSKGELLVFPEDMASKFSSMDATELKGALKFLDDTHPDIAKMARRYTLEAAFKKAAEGAGQRGAGMTKNFAMAEFVKGLPSDEKLTALLGNSKATREVKDIASAMNRLVDYGARQKGSQTAQRTNILDTLSRWGFGAIYRGVVDDTLAEDLLNPAKRMELYSETEKMKKINEIWKQ